MVSSEHFLVPYIVLPLFEILVFFLWREDPLYRVFYRSSLELPEHNMNMNLSLVMKWVSFYMCLQFKLLWSEKADRLLHTRERWYGIEW